MPKHQQTLDTKKFNFDTYPQMVSFNMHSTHKIIPKSILLLPWVVSFALFMDTLDSTIINTAIPSIARDFSVHPLTLKIAITSYLLSLVILLPVSGYIADRFGIKKTFMSAIVIFIIGSCICGLSLNLPMLVCSRILQGVGGALMMPVGRLILIRSMPKSQMVNALSIVGIVNQTAAALGPVVGGALTTWISWRAAFFINIPAGCLALWLSHKWIGTSSEVGKPNKRFDFLGFFLFAIGTLTIIIIMVTGKDLTLPVSVIVISLVAGITALCSYVYYAHNNPNAVIHFTPFKTRTFRIVLCGGIWVRIATSCFPFILPLLFQLCFGFTPFHSGLMLLAYAVGLIGTKLFIPALIRRFTFRTIFLSSITLLSMMFGIFSMITFTWPTYVVVSLCLITGIVVSTIFSAIQNLTYQDIPPEQKSQATGLATLFQQFSVNLSVCAVAFSLAHFNNNNSSVSISLQAFHQTFICFAIISLSSILVFNRLKE